MSLFDHKRDLIVQLYFCFSPPPFQFLRNINAILWLFVSLMFHQSDKFCQCVDWGIVYNPNHYYACILLIWTNPVKRDSGHLLHHYIKTLKDFRNYKIPVWLRNAVEGISTSTEFGSIHVPPYQLIASFGFKLWIQFKFTHYWLISTPEMNSTLQKVKRGFLMTIDLIWFLLDWVLFCLQNLNLY